MSKYTQLIQNGSLPEYISFEQAANVADCLSDKGLLELINVRTIESKELDNGDRVINTVSLLEYMEQLDNDYIKDCQDDRLKYLKDL